MEAKHIETICSIDWESQEALSIETLKTRAPFLLVAFLGLIIVKVIWAELPQSAFVIGLSSVFIMATWTYLEVRRCRRFAEIKQEYLNNKMSK